MHLQKFVPEQNKDGQTKGRKGMHRSNLALHFLLSLSEQLWPAKGFNFRWEIEFCQDMICIRKRFRVSCVVYMQTYVSVGVRHKTMLSEFDREGSMMRGSNCFPIGS